MSVSSLARSPTQQGVVKRPNAAHLRSNILNGHVKVASSTNTLGGQPALYSIVGGTITSNYKVALPDMTADDTFATLNTNNNWTGLHTFQQGLTSVGPIVASGPITAKSIVGAALTSSGAASIGSNISVVGSSTIGGSQTVSGDSTVSGNHTVTLTSSLTGAVTAKGGLTLSTGGTDSAVFNIVTGGTHGTAICSSITQRIGFYGITPVTQIAAGATTAGATYTSHEQGMLNGLWSNTRNLGLFS